MYVLSRQTDYALTPVLFHFSRCCATKEINTKITRSWAHKQFPTRVRTLFYIFLEVICKQPTSIWPDHMITLRWCHNGRDSISNHQPHDGLFNRLFRRRSKKTSKLSVTGICVGNSWGIHRDRWIPRTKGQLRGKCFHLMTSSWPNILWDLLHISWHLSVYLFQCILHKWLNHLVFKFEYSEKTYVIPWLLMTWLLASPGHQQPCYWHCRICKSFLLLNEWLTHWGRATHICVGKLTIIGSDNGLSPGRR